MDRRTREKWDARYADEAYVYGEEPLPLLVEFAHLLPAAGHALDIACGEGRNAVFVAGRGLDTLALDISAEGLRKAQRLAARRGVSIRVSLTDLERHPLPDGPFDVVVCAHYKQRALCAPITAALAPGGVLFVELHTVQNLLYHARPSRPFLVEPNELLSWFPALRLVHYQELVQQPSKHAVAQLIARKLG
jgi:2-polyprenyl-3-methyl-5-hydroxy-6-metoxy-1,4-benzoquinol methylase